MGENQGEPNGRFSLYLKSAIKVQMGISLHLLENIIVLHIAVPDCLNLPIGPAAALLDRHPPSHLATRRLPLV